MKSTIPGHEEVERLEQSLFDSLGRDEPPARARRAIAAALGLGTTVLTSTTAGARGATAVAKARPLLVKWVGLGALAAAVSVSAIQYASDPATGHTLTPAATPRAAKPPSAISRIAEPEPPAPQAAAPPTQAPPPTQALLPAPARRPTQGPLPTQVRPPLPLHETMAAQRASDSLSKPATLAAPAPSVNATEPAIDELAEPISRPSAPFVHSRQLAAEVAMLDAARSALVTNDGARALDILGRYVHEFPAATLNLEATVLRIEALFLTGSTDAAASLGREFLAAHPNSTHSGHVRSLLANHEKQ